MGCVQWSPRSFLCPQTATATTEGGKEGAKKRIGHLVSFYESLGANAKREQETQANTSQSGKSK